MKKLILLILTLVILFPVTPSQAFDPVADFDEAYKAAVDFEKLLFTAEAQTKDFISFIDISGKDGHIVVNIKERMLSAPPDLRESLYLSILKLWRDTKYVREMGYGSYLEVIYVDWQGITKKIKTYR